MLNIEMLVYTLKAQMFRYYVVSMIAHQFPRLIGINGCLTSSAFKSDDRTKMKQTALKI